MQTSSRAAIQHAMNKNKPGWRSISRQCELLLRFTASVVKPPLIFWDRQTTKKVKIQRKQEEKEGDGRALSPEVAMVGRYAHIISTRRGVIFAINPFEVQYFFYGRARKGARVGREKHVSSSQDAA
jgi:hypothetical protein